LITAVELAPMQGGSGYARMADRATLEAVCGVAVAVQRRPDGQLEKCRIATVGATVRPGRIAVMEESVIGTDGSRDPVAPPVDAAFVDNRLASHEYRRHMTPVLAGRALELALGRTPVSKTS
jgi:CO/xanthine dehydrogenase FAD-binding subunit